jgi:integrase
MPVSVPRPIARLRDGVHSRSAGSVRWQASAACWSFLPNAASNPAKQVRSKREGAGRLRYLTREEYDRICNVICGRFPEHLPEFVVSVNTGMRLSEQYSLTWGQFNLERRTIDLTTTKNGSARTVHLNADVVAAFETVKLKRPKSNEPVFPRQGATFDTRSWFHPVLEDAWIEGYV